MKKKSCSVLAINAFLLLLLPFTVKAQETVYPEFNAGVIIPDSAFNDTQTFGGAEGIQKFLESKGSALANTAPDFLTKLNEPNDSALKAQLGDPEPNLGRLRTAAELIWDAAESSGLNPQIILVTMNKEQGLIANHIDPSRLQRALNHAMGFDCPSSSGCGNLFPGFYYQLFGNVDTSGNRYIGSAKSLMKSFTTPGGRGPDMNGAPAKVGSSISLINTLGDYIGVLSQQIVTLENLATAALYRYTPHVFNGNYNFWKFFKSWFKYPNGTLLKTLQDNAVFIIQDGSRQQVPTFVAVERKLNLGSAITASPTELNNYPLGQVYGPTDNTVVSANGSFFVFIDDVMHPVTNFVLQQRKLDATKSLALSSADAALFIPGPQLTPSDGTILRGQTNPAVYLVDHGVLKLYSPFTFKQHKVAKLVQFTPDSEVAIYPKLGYVTPLPGTLIKGKQGKETYVISQEQRLPLTDELFKNLGYKLKDVVTLTNDAELASIPLGAPATPRDGTYFTIRDSSETYLFKNGEKHLVYSFVAKQRHIIADYSFEASIASNWPDGIAIPPIDGTLIKSNASSTVYIITNGQRRPLSAALFKNLGLSFKNVVTLPDNEVSALPKNGFATPQENTYFIVAETGEFFVFKTGTKRPIYPLVAAQRHMTPDYTFTTETVSEWPLGIPVAPLNGTLIQGNDPATTYVVTNNKLSSLTIKAFTRRGYKTKNIKIIPQDQVDSLPKGDPILK
ncbi:MAG: hypothetical protein WC817_04480 [Patescibacteria group bacterium]|jgi:hypothetical protein